VHPRLLFRRRGFWVWGGLLFGLLLAGCALENLRRDINEEEPPAGATPTLPPTPAVTPTLSVLQIPANCLSSASDRTSYFNMLDGYCLVYPVTFQVGDLVAGRVNFYGPALTPGPEPVQATLSILVEGPANGRSVTQLIDELTTADVAAGLTINRLPFVLGGQPAEIVDGLPGRFGTRQLYTIHNDTIYHAILGPVDPAFAQAGPDVEAIWQSVAASFTFMPPAFGEALRGCPLSGPTTAPYLKLEDGYCLLYPSHFRVGDVYPAVTSFYGPPTGQEPEPLQVGMTILIEGNANGLPVVDVVENKLGDLLAQGIDLNSTVGTLGGEPAIVIEGVPGRFATRQLYAIHNDLIYHVTIYPTDASRPEAAADVERVWTLVLGTFTFIDAR
jgi:hypothetical protein